MFIVYLQKNQKKCKNNLDKSSLPIIFLNVRVRIF